MERRSRIRFRRTDRGGERAFCHISAFGNRSRRPALGEIVTYERSKDERGRFRATQIKRHEAGAKKATAETAKPNSTRTPVFTSILFLIAVAALAIAGRIPWFIALVYITLSGIAVFAYAFDKSAAMNRRWRTQESTLLIIGLLGGWPGAWIAQRMFRHKTQKASFRYAFLFTAVVNASVLIWILCDPTSPLGRLVWSL
jgi:uncharacterized membrane protein YsdA (DUF1294 family)